LQAASHLHIDLIKTVGGAGNCTDLVVQWVSLSLPISLGELKLMWKIRGTSARQLSSVTFSCLIISVELICGNTITNIRKWRERTIFQ